jgi:hypothetical protein
MPDANLGTGSVLTATVKVGSDNANLGTGNALTANLKDTGAAVGYGAEYQTIYDAYDTKPDAADAAIDDTMVTGWVSDGVWTKIDGIWVLANHITGADSLRDWKTPANTATAYNNPSWEQWSGWTGNGSNAYIDLNWIPSVNGVNYTRNSASIGGYIRDNVAENSVDFGVSGIHDARLQSRWSGDLAIIRINSNISSNIANTDSRGMFIINRVLFTHQECWKNKVRIINGAVASTGLPNISVYILGGNLNDSLAAASTRQQSMIFIGGGLTQADIDSITNRFETRMDAHGKGVIS